MMIMIRAPLLSLALIPWEFVDKSPVPVSLVWTGMVVAFSLVLYGVLRNRGLGSAAGWIALALAGQACSLQLLWVGSRVRVQVFYGWLALLTTYRGIFLVALLLQAVVVIWGAQKYWPTFKYHWQRLLSWPQTLLLLALALYAGITVDPGVARAMVGGDLVAQAITAAKQATKNGLGLLIFGVGTLNLALAVAAIDSHTWRRLREWWQRRDRRRLPWLCALWVVVISALLNVFVLDRMPHVPDEVAYIFQAKYMAAGRLYLPAPPDAEALKCVFQIVDDNRWYGIFPPGWPLVLAAGTWAGLPWLVTPLLGGISLLLAHVFVRRLYDRNVADVVVLLLAASPWLLFLSASYMAHQFSLVCLLGGLISVERARETGGLGWAAAAGLSLGVLLHVRMLEAVLVAGVAGLWWLSAGGRKVRWAGLAVAVLVGLSMTGLLLAYNNILTGDPLVVPINKYMDQMYYVGANRLGFGPDVGNLGWIGLDALPGHGLIDVLMNTNHNLYLVDFELFGWACGSLLFVFFLLVRGHWGRDLLMWGLVFVLWAGMSLYWFNGGPDFGARYWYLMILPLVVLTVRSCQVLVGCLRQNGLALEHTQRVWLFVALASFLGMVNLMPWRSLDKYHHYRGVRPDIRELARAYNFGDSLVLIRGEFWPDYASACTLNPSALGQNGSGPIYARDLGPESSQRLHSYYPDRAVWVIAGPDETGDGFEVIEGPLPPTRARR